MTDHVLRKAEEVFGTLAGYRRRAADLAGATDADLAAALVEVWGLTPVGSAAEATVVAAIRRLEGRPAQGGDRVREGRVLGDARGADRPPGADPA